MKKIILICLFFFLLPTISSAETIRLKWDYSTDDIELTGFKVFEKLKDNQAYDYGVPKIFADKALRQIAIDAEAKINEIRCYNYVIRAYHNSLSSPDSNEVEYCVIGIRPESPINLSGSYNKETNIVSISWEQPIDQYGIERWQVYYSPDEHPDQYAELGRVSKEHELIVTAELNNIPEDVVTKVNFTAIAFRRDWKIYSFNSEKLSIDIDRTIETPPVPPENVQVDIEFEIPQPDK